MSALSHSNTEGHKLLVAAGGCTELLSCLRAHHGHIEMTQHALCAIGRLCQTDAVAEQLLAAGVCNDVVAGL